MIKEQKIPKFRWKKLFKLFLNVINIKHVGALFLKNIELTGQHALIKKKQMIESFHII